MWETRALASAVNPAEANLLANHLKRPAGGLDSRLRGNDEGAGMTCHLTGFEKCPVSNDTARRV